MTKKDNQRFNYKKMTVVLILIIAVVLVWYTRTVQQIAIEQCFSILDDSRQQTGQMLKNEMTNEQEHLESASLLLTDMIRDFEENQDAIVRIMNAFSADRSFVHWELCLPNEQIIKSDGSVTELGVDYSFEERVQQGIIVSERRTALKDDKTQIIMVSKCIFQNGECIGILSSVIDLNAFAERFLKNTDSYQQSELLVFERGTGDILIDSWQDELANVKDIEPKKTVRGFDWNEVQNGFESGESGHAAFVLEKQGEIMYVSYAPIAYSDWQIMVFTPDSVCMKLVNKNQRVTFGAITLIFLAFLLFFIWIVKGEKRRQQQKQAREEEIQIALDKARQASAAKSEFLSRMSHDIRTPLNAIIGLLDIAEANKVNSEELENNRKKARVAANHLLSLVNDVLNMGKLEEDKVELAHEVFDIRALAQDTLTITQMRAAEQGIALHHEDCTASIPYPYVYGSPLHVRQIFVNILGNAIKYNKPGGMISTHIEIVRQVDNCITYSCSISDTGVGMSPEFMEHLFDPFAQEKIDARSVYHGTGLGMAIAKSLVEKMGGKIDVKSEQGKGSEFIVTIPFEIASQEEFMAECGREENVTIEGVQILLVEDNELNMEIAAELLREQGAVVATAVNGEEAVRIFEESTEDFFDAVLMDIMMPVMDGIEATKRIRALNRKDAMSVPIIALTANAFSDDVKKCMDVGMNAHLAKPIDVRKMIQTIICLQKHSI